MLIIYLIICLIICWDCASSGSSCRLLHLGVATCGASGAKAGRSGGCESGVIGGYGYGRYCYGGYDGYYDVGVCWW